MNTAFFFIVIMEQKSKIGIFHIESNNRIEDLLQIHLTQINDSEYDYHTLVKVAEMAGLAGIVGFHESEDGYIVSFPGKNNTQTLISDHKARLRDLEGNIWQN